MVKVVDRFYEPRGAALELFLCTDPEVLLDGPAGTGKSTALLRKGHYLAGKYPESRGLFFRATRASMTESVLVEFESNVLAPDHPARKGAHRRNRAGYDYPNGSSIVLAGMDMVTRIMSSQYDWAFGFEATEMAESDIEMVGTRLRNNKIPFQGSFFAQLGLDCNPDHSQHWLNLRPERLVEHGRRKGQRVMTRLLSRHEDNPSLTAEYLERLANLTGPRRARLYLGQWVSGVGQIYDMFDPQIHCVYGTIEKRTSAGVYYRVRAIPDFSWVVASVDWGYRRAGVIQVWGVTKDKCMYLIAEIYRRGKNVDWWADRAVELRKEFDIVRFVCDSAEPEFIDKFNDRLGTSRGRDGHRIAIPADKARQTGISVVRDGLARKGDGKPSLFFVRDSLREGPDPDLLDDRLPTCTVQEFPGYVNRTNADGSFAREDPDPECDDHGMDAMRYAAMYVWGSDFSKHEQQPKYAKGTMGDILKHENVGRSSREPTRWV